MTIRRLIGVAVLGLGLSVLLVGSNTGEVDSCSSLETTTAGGQHYRLEGVCVSTDNNQVDALLDEDWKLSVWTGERFVPVVAVMDEYLWLGSSAVQLSFVTLNEDVRLNISASMSNAS